MLWFSTCNSGMRKILSIPNYTHLKTKTNCWFIFYWFKSSLHWTTAECELIEKHLGKRLFKSRTHRQKVHLWFVRCTWKNINIINKNRRLPCQRCEFLRRENSHGETILSKIERRREIPEQSAIRLNLIAFLCFYLSYSQSSFYLRIGISSLRSILCKHRDLSWPIHQIDHPWIFRLFHSLGDASDNVFSLQNYKLGKKKNKIWMSKIFFGRKRLPQNEYIHQRLALSTLLSYPEQPQQQVPS